MGPIRVKQAQQVLPRRKRPWAAGGVVRLGVYLLPWAPTALFDYN
jgi:hypothetical protein